ncbi:HD-GYP domain-containing protein [Halorhodospira halochloris]|uniref:HD domain-containing phosphohydrolase n=1 Tax=Halorhodospira halochloris TaxID=1052 RepID=UPI001EE78827|nr:HD-GYP domain-containing protein [Halorhodospira halochloris]
MGSASETPKEAEALKELSVDQLRPGMYVHDLGVPWVFHPFLYNRFFLDRQSIDRLRKLGIQRIVVDTSHEQHDEKPAAPPTKDYAQSGTAQETDKHAGNQVRAITKEARSFVKGMIEQARAGQAIDHSDVEAVSDSLFSAVTSHRSTMFAFGRIRSRDNYTYQHCVNVSVLLMAFAEHIGMEHDHVRRIGTAGLLHDIGKALIPEEIVKKPGKLTEAEYKIMKTHVRQGVAVLQDSDGIPPLAIELTATHHERMDGGGYPNGYDASKLSAESRMIAMVDVYDALTAVRPYHNGSPPTQGLHFILNQAGHFDRQLCERFVRCVGVYPPGSLVRLSSNELAVVLNVKEGKSLLPVVRIVYDIKRDKMYHPPRVVDLAGSRANLRIESYESPERWPVPPELYLTN